MDPEENIAGYFAAAQIDRLPEQLSRPRNTLSGLNASQRRRNYERCVAATEIWRAADTSEGRRTALNEFKANRGDDDLGVSEIMDPFLQRDMNRLPLSEIEYALDQLGVQDFRNGILSGDERSALDRDGYLDLGQLLGRNQLREMRDRYDALIKKEGANPENAESKGIGRLIDTVVKPINFDGLLDPIFMHPRLLAAVRHILGIHFKFIGSNFHCALPGYGHQGIHADFVWGVKDQPQVVNAVWLIDEFTADNGATRVVPGTHLSGVHPSGDLVNGEPRDLNASIHEEVKLTGKAGSCFVYNAHLWHGGTQNCTNRLRRAQHCFFGRSQIPSSTDVPNVIDKDVYQRLGRIERAVLDIG